MDGGSRWSGLQWERRMMCDVSRREKKNGHCAGLKARTGAL